MPTIGVISAPKGYHFSDGAKGLQFSIKEFFDIDVFSVEGKETRIVQLDHCFKVASRMGLSKEQID